MRLLAFSGWFTALAAASAFAQGNLVLNPGFESPDAGLTIRYTTPGIPAGFSWTVGGAGVDLVGSYWTPHEGAQSLDLNQDVGHPTSTLTPPGSVSQALATDIGVTYLVSFWMAGNPDHSAPDDTGPNLKSMDVTFGTPVLSYSFDVTGHTLAEPGWTYRQFLAVATSSSTTLSFVSTSSGYAGMIVDEVSVTPVTSVPESRFVSLPFCGFLLACVFLRRTHRQAGR